jgi:hypothetical protein
MRVIRIKINLKKIDKERLFKSDKGNVYLDARLVEHENDYGDDGFISQDPTKAQRAAEPDVKGVIIGNFRYFDTEDGKKSVKVTEEDLPY